MNKKDIYSSFYTQLGIGIGGKILFFNRLIFGGEVNTFKTVDSNHTTFIGNHLDASPISTTNVDIFIGFRFSK